MVFFILYNEIEENNIFLKYVVFFYLKIEYNLRGDKMDKFKKICLKLLYPKLIIVVIGFIISIILMVVSMIYLGSTHFISCIVYGVSFYFLLTLCLKTPDLIKIFNKVKVENEYITRYLTDTHLKVNISLFSSLVINSIYAIFQLVLGIYHKSFWFYSLFGYYLLLVIMRMILVRHTVLYKANEEREKEVGKYLFCGWLLLLMNITISIMMFFMIYWNRTFVHHQITTIAMAAYTFTSLTLAIINVIKYRKYNSPIYSATKVISLVAAIVSIITLESTMLTTFGNEGVLFNQIMLGITGLCVSVVIFILSINMIIKGRKEKK